MLSAGWWVVIEGDLGALRELAMHFGSSELNIVEEEDGFYLGSTDLNDLGSTDQVRARGAELLAIACGSAELELGGIRPPHVVAAVSVDEAGEKQRLTP